MGIEKHKVFAELHALLLADAGAVGQSHKAITDGATHSESRQENDKDTRAIESTYLARGLAVRVVALEDAATRVGGLKVRDFGEEDPIALSALVTLRDDDTEQLSYYALSPEGGGKRITMGGVQISVVTSKSPVGRALLGKYAGEEVEVRTPEGQRLLEIVSVV